MTVFRAFNCEEEEQGIEAFRHSPLNGMTIPSCVNISAFGSVVMYAGHFKSRNR